MTIKPNCCEKQRITQDKQIKIKNIQQNDNSILHFISFLQYFVEYLKFIKKLVYY